MAAVEFSQNTVIYERGQKITNLYMIMRGSVRASYDGGSFILRNGDVIGLMGLGKEESYMKYETVENISVLVFPCQMTALRKLFENSVETIRYFMSSLFRQFNELLSQYKLSKIESHCLHNYITTCYQEYISLCSKNHISPGELETYTEFLKEQSQEDVPTWMTGYYGTLEQMISVWDANKTDIDFIVGVLVKAGEDMKNIVWLCQEMCSARQDGCQVLMNENSLDMFDLYMTLYGKLVKKSGFENGDAIIAQRSLKKYMTSF